MNIEQQILSQIVHTEPFARAVLPHLKEEYFADKAAKILFNTIEKFTADYTTIPTIPALQVEIDRSTLDQDLHDSVTEFIEAIKPREPVSIEWLTDRTEEYCQERAMDLALREAIQIKSDPKRSAGEIPKVMQDALNVNFDSKIGHNYFADAEERYDKAHSTTAKISFDLDTLNEATNGGVETKTLNVIMAGCVHPETTVNARYDYELIQHTKNVTMYKLKELLDLGIDVEVDSPDGYVHVLEFVEKGMYEEYTIETENANYLRCNADHLVKTYYGWESASILADINEAKVEWINIETLTGPSLSLCRKTGMMIPIVDIVVDHENHRYYANNIESHNTNVGKSLILCHLAAADVLAGRKVLYITAEMAAEKIASRIDSNLLDISLDLQKDMPKKWFLEKIAGIKAKCGGNVVVREYASNSAHVGHIRHLLQELKQKQGFVPEVIYVDYLNIMACQRYKASAVPKHQYVQAIAEELRGLGQEMDVPVWSATQTNRAGMSSSDAEITDVAESWGLPATVDWFLIVIQPEELAELGQFLCKQEKSRYSNKDKMRKFLIGVDKDKQKLYDLDKQPNLSGGQYEQDLPVFDQGAITEAESFDSFRS